MAGLTLFIHLLAVIECFVAPHKSQPTFPELGASKIIRR
jgi:hypothetical protein